MDLNTLIKEIDKLNEEILAKELNEDNKRKLDNKFRLEFQYNSNHLEGNTLTYSETELLLVFDETRGSHTLREYEEMTASDVAFEMVKILATNKSEPLTERFIKNLNEILLVRPYWKDAITPDGQSTRREISIGDYKQFPNSVRLTNGEIFSYASPTDTPILMAELINWFRNIIESNEKHPLEIAALLHYRFVRIHPFDDGNGRLSRLLMNYVFFYYNYPPVVIKSEDKHNYLSALHDADTGNVESFINYIGKQLLWSLELTRKAANGESLDEISDWKKKLFVIERELSQHEEIQITKSRDVVKEVLNRVFFPLKEEIKDGLNQVASLFLNSDIYIKSSEASFINITTRGKFSSDVKYEAYYNDATLEFDFNEFKKNGTNAFSLSFQVVFTFEKLTYKIFVDGHELVKKYYHQNLTSEETNKIVDACGALAVSAIENNLIIEKGA